MMNSSGAGGSERAGPAPARSILDLMGLAARARGLVTGTDAVRKAVREGKVARVILAADAAPAQQQKLLPLLSARKLPYHVMFSREELGAALGRNPVSAVGLLDPNIARRIAELIAALPSLQDSARRK